MAIHKQAIEIEEFDVIIIGGGTAGCVVAGRLSDLDPNLSIFVIESGHDNYQRENVIYPALFHEHLQEGSDTAITYHGKPSKYLNNRSVIVAAGGILGGGSSINIMLYSRALLSDFDSWNTKGWTGEEMRPFLRKLETYQGDGKSEDHGSNGPLEISSGGFRSKRFEKDFIQASTQMGYPEAEDLQDLNSNNACQRACRFVSSQGIRQDTAHCYLHPSLRDDRHPNLHVLVESHVARILFDQKKQAVGVEYYCNPKYSSSTKVDKKTARAKRRVIVSCGACGTPGVLERSGIGNPDVLNNASVKLVVDLPGVGNDYQDHPGVLIPYHTHLTKMETHDDLLRGDLDLKQAISEQNPLIGWNSVDFCMKTRPKATEVLKMGASFQLLWESDYKRHPSKPLMLTAVASRFAGPPPKPIEGRYVTICNHTAYPYSRGSIHITGPSITDPLDFDPGYLSDRDQIDLEKQVWAYKKTREIIRRTRMFKGEVKTHHPKFPEGSKAGCVQREENSMSVTELAELKDLEYSPEDDLAIKDYLRENICTTWHSLGTCKMAPREMCGVVDENLNVYGVHGLKIIDLSIAPENVAANTNNTAIAIGEKGADILARELGLI